MANRFSLAVASVAAALLLACGDGGEEPGSSAGGPDATASTAVPASPNATGAAGATGSSVDATRFVFGASPGKPVVYWIHTEWWTNCKRIRPVWPDLQAEHGNDIQLIQVDRDSAEGRKFAESYRINYQPAFVVISAQGEVLRAALGPYGPEEVRALVEDLAER